MSDINSNEFPPTAFEKEIVFMECRRNHAMSLCKVAYDGCPEFLKRDTDGDENAEDAFLCACCDCHRSFHHQEIVHKPISQTAPAPNITPSVPVGPSSSDQVRSAMIMKLKPKRKKRVTYSPEMKNQLIRFAESIGWKPTEDNDQKIDSFCSEIEMNRAIFIIWLSNNRHRAL